jgi:hypothetical protein
MKASTERKLIRWFHIIASIPVIGYIYGPVAEIPEAVTALKWIIFPLLGFIRLMVMERRQY